MRTLDYHAARKAQAHRQRDDGDLCPARRPHGHAGHAQRAREPRVQDAAARPLQGDHRPPRRDAGRVRRDHQDHQDASSTTKLKAEGIEARGLGAGEIAVVDRHQDRAQADRARAALRHDRLPRHRADRSTIATARSASSTPTGRSCQAASRTTSRSPSTTTTARSTPPSSGSAASAPSCRSAPRRCTASPSSASPRTPLYKEGATERPPQAREREPGLRLAAPDHRAPHRRRLDRGLPRIHQARAVPGPGVLLHPARPADRPAARRDAHRLRLCAPHRHRRHLRRRQDQRRHHAARDASALGRRSRDHPRPEPPAARQLGDHRRDRQGPRRHPPRRAHRRAAARLCAGRARAVRRCSSARTSRSTMPRASSSPRRSAIPASASC